MRTLIDLEDVQITDLDRLAGRRQVSRAALLREAVAEYLERNRPAAAEKAFGLWAGVEDGLAYQERLRSEW